MSALNIFNPSSGPTKRQGGRAVKPSISQALPVPFLPASTGQEDRVRYIAFLALCGTSKTESVTAWKLYIVSYTLALFPMFEGQLDRTIYSPVPITPEVLQSISLAMTNLDGMIWEENTETLSAQERALNALSAGPGLPQPDPEAWSRYILEEAQPKILVCHYAILLFMAGKRVDGSDHTPLTRARPEALIKKSHLPVNPELLMGSIRFSDESHVQINNAWQELALLRSLCFTSFAEYEQDATNDLQDIIYTTMHLLKYSGMQHAKIVNGFLQAYPWAREVPALRTAISKFDQSILSAARYPKKVQPYIKLIYGDKADIFPRKEMEVLISCAVSASEETSPDIVNFYTSEAFTSIVEAFMAERSRRGNVRTLTLRADEHSLLSKLGHLDITPATEEEEEEVDQDEEHE